MHVARVLAAGAAAAGFGLVRRYRSRLSYGDSWKMMWIWYGGMNRRRSYEGNLVVFPEGGKAVVGRRGLLCGMSGHLVGRRDGEYWLARATYGDGIDPLCERTVFACFPIMCRAVFQHEVASDLVWTKRLETQKTKCWYSDSLAM